MNQRKEFSIQAQMDIPAQLDANKEKYVALAAWSGTAPSTLNTIVNTKEDTKMWYVQCVMFSAQVKA
jgi:hypothetical protein